MSKYITECECCHEPLIDCTCPDGPTFPDDDGLDATDSCPLCHSPMLAQHLWELLNKEWPAIRIVKAARAVVAGLVR